MEGAIIAERESKCEQSQLMHNRGERFYGEFDMEIAQLWKFGLKFVMSYFP